ncbi:hypothetical protein, partial [Pleionea sp. CnH1-48]|uniref:hypothetical protein n=1 Tax=Pleionea sp. CnH1-48 TaxID=2954494 RepID=UPI0020985686
FDNRNIQLWRSALKNRRAKYHQPMYPLSRFFKKGLAKSGFFLRFLRAISSMYEIKGIKAR